mgnify:CR=1 FL=1
MESIPDKYLPKSQADIEKEVSKQTGIELNEVKRILKTFKGKFAQAVKNPNVITHYYLSKIGIMSVNISPAHKMLVNRYGTTESVKSYEAKITELRRFFNKDFSSNKNGHLTVPLPVSFGTVIKKEDTGEGTPLKEIAEKQKEKFFREHREESEQIKITIKKWW